MMLEGTNGSLEMKGGYSTFGGFDFPQHVGKLLFAVNEEDKCRERTLRRNVELESLLRRMKKETSNWILQGMRAWMSLEAIWQN